VPFNIIFNTFICPQPSRSIKKRPKLKGEIYFIDLKKEKIIKRGQKKNLPIPRRR
jgi:hypothetical protein